MGEIAQLFDPAAFAIVLAGTLLATLARCGWGDVGFAIRSLATLLRPSFDIEANRSALAQAVQQIDRAGPLCADANSPPDASLARILEAYLRCGRIETLDAHRRADHAIREARRARAVQAFEYAGELAPVFGLVGTLFAITQLAPGGPSDPIAAAMSSIATAVLSTLYGVLFAHLLCIPIARAIDRRGKREEEARDHLFAWFLAQVGGEQAEASLPLREAA